MLVQLQQKFTLLCDKNINTLYKPLILIGFFLFLFYNFIPNHQIDQSPQYSIRLEQAIYPYQHHTNHINDPTNSSHIVIGIASTVDLVKFRKPYIESWWQPNVTKGYLYLDREPTQYLPWPTSSIPYRVSENTSKYEPYNKHPMKSTIRMVRVIAEAFREACELQGVRWFVMTDDDTILFLENLVDVLQKYDHKKYFYIGENSESLLSNFENSFEMAFGGAGYAISYPLAEALAKNLDVCIKRYPTLYGSDHLMQSCVADLGVSLTHEKGFHQIDLHSNILGYLSSHPQVPIVSLHHLDVVDPLFPGMDRSKALNHLMKAAKADQSRLVQQTICYDKTKNWSFSIAWGYTTQIYEKIIPPSVLEMPLETFIPWRKPPKHPYMFNRRWLSRNPCDVPHVFFFESVEIITKKNEIVTSYTRRTTRNLPPCSRPSPNNQSNFLPSQITKIIVISPTTKYVAQAGSRRECCDILGQIEKNVTTIKYRSCADNEILSDD